MPKCSRCAFTAPTLGGLNKHAAAEHAALRKKQRHKKNGNEAPPPIASVTFSARRRRCSTQSLRSRNSRKTATTALSTTCARATARRLY